MNYNYRICQILKDGTLWRSSGTNVGDLHKARCDVLAGHYGEPRAAVEEESNRIVFSIDKDGRGTAASVQLFVKALKEQE